MATISTIKQSTNNRIRVKTNPRTVSTGDVADNIDLLADEVRSRGMIKSNNVAGLAAISGANTRYTMVRDFGLFEFSPTGTPNGTTVFPAQDSGTWTLIGHFGTELTEKITVTEDYEYTPDPELLIETIAVKPSVAMTIDIGFTSGGGDVLMAEPLVANKRKGIQQKIFGDETPSIFFTGITASTEIIIYRRRL